MCMKIYSGSAYSSYDRHLIWKCKYLETPIEKLSRKDRKMVEQYFKKEAQFNRRVREETMNIYAKKEKMRGLAYEKIPLQEKTIKLQPVKKKKIDTYEAYKQEQERKELQERNLKKNQILKF